MKAERVSLADLLGIQVLRRLDQNEAKYCADIDAPLAAEAPRDHRGHLKNPARVLAKRADQILQTRHGIHPGWVGEVVNWLRVIRVVGYLIVLGIAFGLAEPWLREGQIVNVEWIFGFLATLVVSMTITSLLMVTAIFARRKGEDSPGETPAGGGAANTFAKLLIVHWLMQFLFRRAVPWIERRILKRSGDKSPEEIRRIENVTEALYDTFSQQSRRMALEAAATSNMMWFLLSVGVLLSLGKMGLFREYDFRWQATIVSEEFMLDATQAMARPLQGLPLVSQPTQADVRWLATGELSAGDATTQTAEEGHQYHRQLWGRLFLAYLLYYGVFPRFILVILSRWLAARGWKGLRPKLKDPYFKTIVENIESPPFESSQEEASEAGDQEPEIRGERGGVSPPVLPKVPTLLSDHETVEPRSREQIPIGTQTVVLSYDVQEPGEGWPKTLSMTNNGQVIDLGNVGDRAARKRITAELATAPERHRAVGHRRRSCR